MTVLLSLLASPSLAGSPMADHGSCMRVARRGPRPASIGSVSSGEYPIEVHYNRARDEAKAVLVLEYAELAWQVQVNELGFHEPIADGKDGNDLDIYLTPVGELEAYAYAEGSTDVRSGDGYNSLAAYIAIDDDLPERWVPSYVTHEFNHVLQWATDMNEPTYPLWEGTAVAAQHWTLGAEEGIWDYDVDSFQEMPFAPALVGDSYALWDDWKLGWAYEYGAALWVMHLDEIAGDNDGRNSAALWEETANEGRRNEPDVVDAFAIVAQDELGYALNRLAVSRFIAGPDWDERGFEAAADWSGAQLVPANNNAWSDLPYAFRFDPDPMITGQGFVDVDLTGVDDDLTVRVTSMSGLQSGLMVMWWADDGSVGEIDDVGQSPEVTLETAGLVRVVAAVTNLGPKGWDGDDDPYVHGDQVVRLYGVNQELPTGGLWEEPTGRNGGNNGAVACGCVSRPGAPWGLWSAMAALWAVWGRRRA